MKPFDIINTDGYDIVATAGVYEGGGPYTDVIVLNNNSTTYIVAMRYMQSSRASVRSIWSYDSTMFSDLNAYRSALRDMIHCALTN